MSEEVHNNQEEKAVEEVTNQEVDVAKLMERVERLEASKNRVEEESKSWKSKFQGLAKTVEDEKRVKLEETENWKELLEIEKNRRSDYEVQLRDTKKAVLQKELNFKVASLAKDAYDVGDVINSLPKDMIEINEEDLSINGISEAINSVRESKPHLFQRENKSGMTSSRPSGDVPKDKSFEEQLLDDPNSMLGDVLKDFIK